VDLQYYHVNGRDEPYVLRRIGILHLPPVTVLTCNQMPEKGERYHFQSLKIFFKYKGSQIDCALSAIQLNLQPETRRKSVFFPPHFTYHGSCTAISHNDAAQWQLLC
jgi:hypothetical protein